MIRISRMLQTVLPLMIVFAAMPVSSQTTPQTPVIDSTSSGLFTFSREERAIRVAAVFAAKDPAVVPTLVRFLDQRSNVLKEVRGDLSENNAVVAELTREDVTGRGDLLVRVQVLHKLPGLRRARYPIVVSTQAICATGCGCMPIFWRGGSCGNPQPQPAGALAARPSQRSPASPASPASPLDEALEPDQPVLPGQTVDGGTQVNCPGPTEAF
jgi:hypothetical protein